MGWDIFRVRKKRDELEDELQGTIHGIEKFAPKKYRQEREMYYYNYRQTRKYLKPLLALLMYISENAGRKGNEEIFVQGLFGELKGFYDVNNTLSIKEAIKDSSLKIKLLGLFKIFYDDTMLTRATIENYLRSIE